MNILISFGGIGLGIAEKIDTYMFQGEVQAALYSGSGVTFLYYPVDDAYISCCCVWNG